MQSQNNTDSNAQKPNRLIHEKSPYLLQHAYNPVDWYSWSEEAFKRAEDLNKPIFLSIGYSTCHWCHVMEKESFEDREVADYLNEHFISIKVDKEERPDIDNVYMTVCQTLTGSGGWPLTILMFPNQKPFYAGTYFPKVTRLHMIGLMDLLKSVITKWEEEPEMLINSSQGIVDYLKKQENNLDLQGKSPELLIRECFYHFMEAFEPIYGGFGQAPKFPSPHNLMFLMRYALLEQKKEACYLAEKTLTSMFQGGIYDHIGSGFSRYSTDDEWLIPHFEKMLYDNALLIIAYIEAYQLTGNLFYKNTAISTLQYISREMSHEEGGFYSAQDADSEGVEGKYYTFTERELVELLGEEEGTYFNAFFNITAPGNFEGVNIPNRILHMDKKSEGVSSESRIPILVPEEYLNESFLDERILKSLDRVYNYRLSRVKLHKDDKVLTSWNGLMIAAYAKAYAVFHDETYLRTADDAFQFILKHMTDADGNLRIRYREGESAGCGHIDDYAFFIWASLELYRASYQTEYLENAKKYADLMIQLFYDMEQEGFYHYSASSESLIIQPKEVFDGAIPSGNSVAFYCLNQLSSLTMDSHINNIADRQSLFLSKMTAPHPFIHCFTMMGFMQGCYKSAELIAVMKDPADINSLRKLLSKKFYPNLNVLVITEENRERMKKLAPYTSAYDMNGNRSTFYLCHNHVCHSPVHNLEELEKLLHESCQYMNS